MIEELWNDVEACREEEDRLWDLHYQEPYAQDLADAAQQQDYAASAGESLIYFISTLIEPGRGAYFDYVYD